MEKLVITTDVLKTEDAQNFVACPSAGAISIFIGTTRDSFEDKKVTRLEYEAYDSMAYKELGKLCQDIRTKWNVTKICILHRLGVVPIGEVSVIIAISSAHRREAMEAVQYCIDTLKAQVPIWKKEIYSDGAGTWKENSEHTSYKVENSS